MKVEPDATLEELSGWLWTHGHWLTSTFLAALRQDEHVAPCLFDGAINGETFRVWVEQFLVPTSRPGDIVIKDNLGSHKVGGIRQAPAGL